MTRARALVVAALLAVGAAVVPASAAPAPPGTLVLSSSRTASTTVTLAQDAVVDLDLFGGVRGWSLSGDGRLVGVVLHRLPASEDDAPLVLTDLSFGLCFAPGCRSQERTRFPFATGVDSTFEDDGTQRVTLPAGRYRLLLVADGAPVTVRLPGLGAAGPVQASSDAVLTDLEPVLGAVPQRQYVAEGLTASHEVPTLVVTQDRAGSAAGYVGEDHTCYIAGEGPPEDLYAPGCPTTSFGDDRASSGFGAVVVAAGSVSLGTFSTALVPPGTWSVGGWHARATPITSHDAMQARIELR